MKKIALFLFDGFSDWEIAYLTPEIRKNEGFELVYFSRNGEPVTSMGGMTVLPVTSFEAIDANEVEMLILPGGFAWETNQNDFMKPLVEALNGRGKTIAAICAATTFLGRLGLLNDQPHTSNVRFYLEQMAPGYSGQAHYSNSPAVTGKNIITANSISPVEFAREIFGNLLLYPEAKIESWFQLFKNGVWSEG